MNRRQKIKWRSGWLTVLSAVLLSTSLHAAEPLQCQALFASKSSLLNTAKRLAVGAIAGTAALFPFVAMAAGGFSGTGGGEGVAQFQNAEDARLAQGYIAAGKPIPDELLQRARLITLERWEMERNGVEPFSHAAGSSWLSLFERARANLRLVSPVVDRRLDQVSEWMAFSNWQPVVDLPHLGDARPNQQLGNKDVRLQLALRFSEGNNPARMGPTQGRLNLKVLLNQPLFARLDPLDQAMLVFHEELYVLAQAVGQRNSDEVRPLVQAFFSEHIDKNVRRDSENGVKITGLTTFFKEKLLHNLGDYPMFFASLDVPPSGASRTPQRHFASFVAVINELRESITRCLATGQVKDFCAHQAMTEFASRNDVSEEKAFVFFAYFFLEKRSGVMNAEALMDDKSSAQTYAQALALACAQMIAIESHFTGQIKAIHAAARYCR